MRATPTGRPHKAGPLPSGNEGAAKSAVRDFVALVTKDGRPDYVPPPVTANLSYRATSCTMSSQLAAIDGACDAPDGRAERRAKIHF